MAFPDIPHIPPQLKPLSASMDRFKAPATKARNGKEVLIEDIVSHGQCLSDGQKRELAKRIATKADETGLHTLLQEVLGPHDQKLRRVCELEQ